jgi:hypothetical protein
MHKPDNPKMLAWVTDELAPYIEGDLFPLYINRYYSLVLDPGAFPRSRVIVGSNTTPTEAVREVDLGGFGDMIASLIAKFGDRLWTADKPSRVVEQGKVTRIRQGVGPSLNYEW